MTTGEGAGRGWQPVGVAVQGTSHLRMGLPCQDAVDFRALPGGGLVVTVADGAGTAFLAEKGARAAASCAAAVLAQALQRGTPSDHAGWQELLRLGFLGARQALDNLAGQAEASLRHFATTLTCAVAVPGWLATGQIGDGAVIAWGPDDVFFTASALQRGEYANETHFLSQDQALDQVEVRVIACDLRGLAVMSDGLTRLALLRPRGQPHAPFFRPLFAFASAQAAPEAKQEQLAAFLASERVNARTDDDKALVLAVRGPDSAA